VGYAPAWTRFEVNLNLPLPAIPRIIERALKSSAILSCVCRGSPAAWHRLGIKGARSSTGQATRAAALETTEMRLHRDLPRVIRAISLVVLAIAAGSCGGHGRPSQADQAYFEVYSRETRQTIAWWKQQVDTAQLIRYARGAVGSEQSAIAADAAAKRDEALRTLGDDYGLTSEEIQAVTSGQSSRKIEEKIARGRKRLEIRIDRLEKIFSQTCKDFEKNPGPTVEELKKAENNLERYLKAG
jgi:hypothetical protein